MIGEKLGTFRIDSVLGTGAMGVVYRATSESTGKPAAVKVIGAEVMQKTDPAQLKKADQRFRREADILYRFRHPHIVRVLAIGKFRGTSYIAMEFIQGETIEQRLKRRGPMPWREVVPLAIQLCEALHYAHEHGVVHRDLKPSNLMVNEKGELKLTDFGIAKLLDEDATALTATGRTLGTAAYMAPEQIRGTPEISHKTDLYALGVVLYQMLTGRAPFEGGSPVNMMHLHLNEPAPRPSGKVAEVPRALDDLVVKLMSKSPNDRPWDAAAVAVTLADLRDKAQSDQTIPMVWPGDDAAREAGTGTAHRDPLKKTRSAKRKPRLELPAFDVELAKIGLMIFALAAMAGFVAYMLWPPSARYLYAQAEHLMASDRRHDWKTAVSNFIDPLDRRFPAHPYKSQTQAWRDRIPLADAVGRAKILDSPVRTAFSDPARGNKGEHEYVLYSALAKEASGRGDDREAVREWEEMAGKLNPNDADERPWVLLAGKRAADLQKEIAQRHGFVTDQLVKAEQAERAGRAREAATIRENIVGRYGRYTDVADLLARAGLAPPPESNEAPATAAGPRPKTNGSPPAANLPP